jgi:hypothetical protein
MYLKNVKKLSTSDSLRAVVVTTPNQGPPHQFDLWYTTKKKTSGFGTYDASTQVTSWSIKLNETNSLIIQGLAPNEEFEFLWGPELNEVTTATPTNYPPANKNNR